MTVKANNGTLILSGSDSYGGGTNVEAGTLVVTNNTALADGSSLTVGAGGTFGFDPSQAMAAPVEGSSLVAQSGRVVSAVPEPGTLALLSAAGIVAVAATWRKRRSWGN